MLSARETPPAAAHGFAGQNRGMRLVTFNVQHGRGSGTRRVDVGRLEEAIRALEPDVLALQEVDHRQLRSGRADLTAVAGRAMGAADARLAVTLRGPVGLWHEPRHDEPPRGAAYGVALLTRYPARRWRTVRLPRRRGVTWAHREGRRLPRPLHDHPRAALAATLDTPLGTLTAVCAHLSFVSGQNAAQARFLVDALVGAPRPLVLLGDLNLGPTSAARSTGMTSLADALTYPMDAPTAQIDHMLVDGRLRATGPARSVATGVSDHRALVVDVELTPND